MTTVTAEDVAWMRERDNRCLTYEQGHVHRCNVDSCDWNSIILWAGYEIDWDNENDVIAENTNENLGRDE